MSEDGFYIIACPDGLLLLTEEEYRRFLYRGQITLDNRRRHMERQHEKDTVVRRDEAIGLQ